MVTTQRLESAVYAAGWVEGRIDDLHAGYTKANNKFMVDTLTEMRESFLIVSTTFDELIKENRENTDRLISVRNALL